MYVCKSSSVSKSQLPFIYMYVHKPEIFPISFNHLQHCKLATLHGQPNFKVKSEHKREESILRMEWMDGRMDGPWWLVDI